MQQQFLRNIAIIAHVDHGKTTLVDAMLRHTKAVRHMAAEGALVMEVMPGTPAEKSGLKAGDVIVRIDGEAIGSPGDIHQALRGKEGKDVSVTVIRDHREMTLKVSLEPEEIDSHSYLPPGVGDQIRHAIGRARRMPPLPERIRIRNKVRDVVEI